MSDVFANVPIDMAAAVVLALLPVLGLIAVRQGHSTDRPALSALRYGSLFVLLALAFMLATVVDDLPTALGLLGGGLAMFGLGIGVEPLYRFLYGEAWLVEHPGAARADVARCERVTLLLAMACLLSAVLLALRGADVAAIAAVLEHGPRTEALRSAGIEIARLPGA